MFHLAFPVINLKETIQFYTNILGASIGRSSSKWIDFNLKWNQITVHEDPRLKKLVHKFSKEGVPINHFGVIVTNLEWIAIKDDLITKDISFLVEPRIVFEGEVGEQYSFFVEDPSGYAIEFKGFKEFGSVFKRTENGG